MKQEPDKNTEDSEGTEPEEFYEHFRLEVDKGQQPLRIDKFLVQRIQNASRNRIQNAIEAGAVRVNDKVIRSNYKIRPLDTIAVLLPEPPRDTELKGENIPLDIVYEDDKLLVVNKPAGMVVHPGYNNYTGTLVNALVHHFDNLPTANGERRPGLVHRIDKDTSGLVVIAKEEFAMTHLAKQFYEHTIERAYAALVWGSFDDKKGTVDASLARSPKDRRVVQVTADTDAGKHAITHYEVLEEFFYTTLVECRLETGRTHQIRAHMQHLGHPIFNDAVYGGEKIIAGPAFTKYKQFIQNCFAICPRQALHARVLGFIHPYSKEKLRFEAPFPPDMEGLLEKWRAYAKTGNKG